jgi:hypothetical protein
MKKIQLLKRRDFSLILNDATEFSTKSFGKYSKAFLYFVMPPLLVLMAVIAYMFNDFSRMIAGMRMRAFDMSVLAPVMSFGIIIFILASLVSIVQNLLAYEYILLYEKSEDPSEITVEGLWAMVKQDFVYMMASYLGILLLFVVFMSVSAGAVALLMYASRALGALLIFALFFLWIYMLMPLSNFFMVRLRERRGIIDSVGRCFALARGKWWRTFGLVFIVTLVVSFMQAVAVAPLSITNTVITFHKLSSLKTDPTAIYTPLYALTQSLSIAVSIYLSAIVAFTMGINYFSLVESTDNTSLLDEIQSIGAKTETGYNQEGEY